MKIFKIFSKLIEISRFPASLDASSARTPQAHFLVRGRQSLERWMGDGAVIIQQGKDIGQREPVIAAERRAAGAQILLYWVGR